MDMSRCLQSRKFHLVFRSFILKQNLTSKSSRNSSPPLHLASSAPHPISRRSFHNAQCLLKGRESLGPQTFYEFFPQTLPRGPPPQGPFAIDLAALRREFYQLQTRAHPDRFPADQKTRAEGLSARINEAYKALQDPLQRAQYLLSLRGINVAEDETAKVEDPELLMEVLEMREAIEAIQEESELIPLKDNNDALIQKSVGILDDAFNRDDTRTAQEEAVKLRYWTNIKESLDAWEKGKPVVLIH